MNAMCDAIRSPKTLSAITPQPYMLYYKLFHVLQQELNSGEVMR